MIRRTAKCHFPFLTASLQNEPMVIFQNNKRTIKIEGSISSIEELCIHLGIDKERGFAVSVNNVVVPPAHWRTFNLKDTDQVAIIKAIQGG